MLNALDESNIDGGLLGRVDNYPGKHKVVLMHHTISLAQKAAADNGAPRARGIILPAIVEAETL